MCKTRIDLLIGTAPAAVVPSFVEAAGLSRRIAVIQHTYRADSVDMYFDEPLWLRLIEFAVQSGGSHEVTIVDRTEPVNRSWWRSWWRRTPQRPEEADELCLGAYLAKWNDSADPCRDPAECIVVRDGEHLVLCVATEYWTQVGGPAPYADSHTYSIFCQDDVVDAVARFLGEAESANEWELSTVSA